MKLCLKNIGKISTASVEINGITVIAGENDTGKSTVGRALFAVFNSLYNTKDQIGSELITSIRKRILYMCANLEIGSYQPEFATDIAQMFVKNIEKYQDNSEAIRSEILYFLEKFDSEIRINSDVNRYLFDETVHYIKSILNVPDTELIKLILEKKLSAEFHGQISNIFATENGEIQLWLRNQSVIVSAKDSHIVDVQNEDNVDLHTEAVYLDDPFVLDKRVTAFSYMESEDDHQKHLKDKLFSTNKKSNLVDEIVAAQKLEHIYPKVSSVCSGEIVHGNRYELEYKVSSDKILDVRNLSAGLKTFAILKMLLTKGIIEYNGTIILDEPEIHLHPEWQLVFAELIVLIHKEFGIHILLNTHSPYFLNAIEVYAAKYEVNHKCKYYLSSIQGQCAQLEDVTNDVERIYAKLARPLQELENERNRYD